MLTSVKILSPTLQRRCGKIKVEFEAGINLFIGPNGSGKSTLLNAIRSVHQGTVGTSKVELTVADPRFPMPLFYHSADGAVREESVNSGSNLGALQSRSESHGQTLSRYLIGIENQIDPAVFLIDEPEVALCLENLVSFRDMVLTKVEEGMMFIIASHHPAIWTLPGATIHTFGKDKNYVKNSLKIHRSLVR